MAARITIYTVGHGNDEPAHFIARLQRHGVTTLFDVRRFPNSARLAHFKKGALAAMLAQAGIHYNFAGEALGGFRESGYPAYMQTDRFRHGICELIAASHNQKITIMCAELAPQNCHRRYIADTLLSKHIEVRHILKNGACLKHRLSTTGKTLNLFDQ